MKLKNVKINLRVFADIESVIESNQDAFKDNPDFGTSFSNAANTLKELGYDVLINQRDKAEFVPASRLGEVSSQRDMFKTQVQALQKQLETLQKDKTIPQEVQQKLSTLTQSNTELLQELENSKVNFEILSVAHDAIKPSAVIPFINRDAITIDNKGNVIGVDKEVERVKAEMPFLFNNSNGGSGNGEDRQNHSSGFSGNQGGGSVNSGASNMNALIRRAAGLK